MADLPSDNRRHRVVAFYLPQYHPIAENDEWWGPGFTEWTNVTSARPLFPGHYQPRLPSELGFYDLRVPEIRQTQAELAQSHGVDAFCYYHYWFNGRRLLERPLASVLSSGEPDMPFMICWANENWTRLWNGGDKQVLLSQQYSAEDDRAHIRALIPILSDDRYLTIDGHRVLCIYRAGMLPDANRTAERWREEAERAGLSLFLCATDQFGETLPSTFDASIQFVPQRRYLGRRLIPSRPERALRRALRSVNASMRNHMYSYDEMVTQVLNTPKSRRLRFPCVAPDWDNAARRQGGDARILIGSTPQKYGAWLRRTLESFEPPSPERNLVFVNAWNEWAEGAYLEPDRRWGRAYLEAHWDAVRSTIA